MAFLVAMPSRAVSAEPLGLLLYQLGHPDEFPETGARIIRWSPAVQRDILDVDSTVNHTIRPRLDEPGSDVWQFDAGAGDCEDFALAKRVRLIRMGYPPGALRLTVVTRNKPRDHVVLTVVTSKRRYILDVPGR